MSERFPAEPDDAPLRKINIFQKKDEVSDELTGKDILKFAKQILFFLFLLVVVVFVGSYVLSALLPDNERVAATVTGILDTTKTVVPSIATLVLGFYFGKKDAN